MFKISWSFTKTVWVLFYVLVFVFLLHHSLSFLDPDFGWHLRAGQDIALSGQVPNLNYSNYTLLGEPWVDHEWLANLTIYKLYTNFGYLVINFIFCLIPLLVLILLNYCLRQFYKIDTNKHLWLLIFFEYLSLLAITPHLGVRIQEITLLFLLLLLIIIFKYNANKNYLILWCLLPLFYFWSNLHGGFLLGLLVLILFMAVKIFEAMAVKWKALNFLNFDNLLDKREIIIFASFSVLAFVVTFLTPYRGRLYSFLFSFKNTYYLTHIVEWLPQWNFPYQYWQLSYIAVLIVMLGFLFISVFKEKKEKINLWDFSLLCLLLAMAIKSRRHFPLLFVASFPWMFNNLLGLLDLKNRHLKIQLTPKNDRLIALWLQCFLLACFLLVIASFAIKVRFINRPFASFCENTYVQKDSDLAFPCQAVSLLKSKPELQSGRLFNNFGWGGYLIWQYPTRQLFIDGRMPQAEYKGRTILEEYVDFFKKDKAEAKLNEYNISLVLLSNKKQLVNLSWWEKKLFLINEADLNSQKNYLEEHLKNSAAWRLIYQDKISAIYQRK